MPIIPKNCASEIQANDGLIPRCIRELFNLVAKKKDQAGNLNKITVTC